MAERTVTQGRPYAKAGEEAVRQELAGSIREGTARWLDLPHGLRFRFWWQHQVNAAGIWLTDHGHCRAAVLLWRLCRMW